MRKLTLIFIICCSHLYGHAQNWEQVGLGSIAIDNMHADTIGNFLYAAGHYYTATGDTIFGIGKWDGTKWDSLGPGIGNGSITLMPVSAIETYNGELYVSGWSPTEGILVNGMARWDGVNWDSVGIGTGGSPDLHVYNNELYAGGFFKFDNGVVSKIAKWDGVKWDSIGSPSTYLWDVFGGIYAIDDFNGELFLGGPIFAGWTTEGIPKEGVTRWNGITWEGLIPHGVHSTCFSLVNTFEIYNGELYIGGCFKKGGSMWPNVGNNIVRWDGDSLHDVGGGVNSIIWDLAVYNNELYAVGDFWEAGGVPAAYIAKWNGTEWCSLGSQFNGPVWTIEVFNNELYIGGGFTTIDGYNIKRVAKWIGGNVTDSCGVLIGIEEETKTDDTGLNIYPNPTTGLITITGLPKEATTITIYNVLSELVYNQPFTDLQINISELPEGVYFLMANTNGQIQTNKIVKL